MRQYKGFSIFFVLLFLAIYVVENINGRFWLSDFNVYYGASEALLKKEPVYGLPFGLGTGFYKYSPEFLLFMAPFTAMSFKAACTLQYVLIVIALWMGLFTIRNLFRVAGLKGADASGNWFLALSVVCVINHLVRELHLGNVNVWIVFLLCSGLHALAQQKANLSGFLFAMTLFIKPYLIVVLLPLEMHKQYKVIRSLVISGAAFILLFTLFVGWDTSLALHQQWIEAMIQHNDYLSSRHTLSALIERYTGLAVPAVAQFVFLILMVLVYVLVFATRLSKREKENQGTAGEYRILFYSVWILLAFLPNILITDTEHFLYSLPILMSLLLHVMQNSSIPRLLLFVILVFLFGGNSSDLLGTALSERVEEAGVLGLANLGILTWTLIRAFRNTNTIAAHG